MAPTDRIDDEAIPPRPSQQGWVSLALSLAGGAVLALAFAVMIYIDWTDATALDGEAAEMAAGLAILLGGGLAVAGTVFGFTAMAAQGFRWRSLLGVLVGLVIALGVLGLMVVGTLDEMGMQTL